MSVAWGAVCNHLWQSTVFAAMAWVVATALRGYDARVRHAVWVAASLKFLLPFSLLIALGGQMGPAPRTAPVNLIAPSLRDAAAAVQPMDPTLGTPGPEQEAVSLLLGGIWFVGFLAVRARVYRRWRQARLMLRGASLAEAGREAEMLRAAGSRVRPAMVPQSTEPGVFGIVRPVIFLPTDITAKLDDAQLRAILTHELCHVRRRDNLTASLHMIVEAVFWFHPLVWWLGARLLAERERVCDEEVLRMGNEPTIYASSILQICESCLESPLPSVSGVTGSGLKSRIEWIASNCTVRSPGRTVRMLLSMAVVIVILLPVAVGWTKSGRFESASITPVHSHIASPQASATMERDGLHVRYVTLSNCIEFAYGLNPGQVAGPAWIDIERYTIVLRASHPAAEDQLREMFQTLLAERFKLRFHRVREESHESNRASIETFVIDRAEKLPLED